ncbi:MAG TPA: lipid-A-disaccharide synthase [Candidatus Polarisedimenticolia bacterium]|nr:lipid-A-disaccharide synthase [Candidatus Polarisedimenticolia bacterium]
MIEPAPRVLLVAGEASGDLYGSLLVRALRKRAPGTTFSGIGGERMREEGVHLFADSKDLAVVGLTEVLSHWKPIRAAFRQAKRSLHRTPPDLLLLIDYPDFNLRLAREAKQANVPVVYFISPQVWAWRRSRVRSIARWVNKMLVILPFEEAIYREAGVPVEFVGHPLLDILPPPFDRRVARVAFGWDPERRVVGLLPGSRRKELETHFPVMLECAALLKDRVRDFHCVVPVASTLNIRDFEPYLERAKGGPEIHLVQGRSWEVLGTMDAAVVKSGTATLEAALLGVPLVVAYRTSRVTYALASLLAHVRDVGLVNIVAGKRLVPELVQKDFTAPRLADALHPILTRSDRARDLREELIGLRKKLGEPGCFERAAHAIHEVLQARVTGPGGDPIHD